MSVFAAITMYHGMILPFFDYADIIYEACNKGILDSMQKMQNRGLRIAAYKHYRDKSSEQ